MQNNINEHLAQPEIGVVTHVRRKQKQLANEIRNRKKVYLDTKYWVILREVRLGRSNCSDTTNLLNALEAGVASGGLVCPFNADIYFELMKQDDQETLMATARLIDDLSLGVCMLHMGQRIESEIFQFVTDSIAPKASPANWDDHVWTKIVYVLGFVTPNCYALPDNLNLALQKSFTDMIWTMKLSNMLSIMGLHKIAARKPARRDITPELNAGKLNSAGQHRSFKSVFLSEIRGILDSYQDSLCDMLQYIFTRDTGKELTDEERQDSSGGRLLENLIYEAFRLNKITTQLPSIRIGAGLHAALRWDVKRRYKANDLTDFHHAMAALPYCDFFFTERPLTHLLRDRNLKFDERFKCRSVYRPADALSLLRDVECSP